MSTPFQFTLTGGFTSGLSLSSSSSSASSSASTTAPTASTHITFDGTTHSLSSLLAADTTLPFPLPSSPSSFPLSLTSPSLPPSLYLHPSLYPLLHPLRGRCLATSSPVLGATNVMVEQAMVSANWDEFRCIQCDLPHSVTSCIQCKKLFTKKQLISLNRIENTIIDAKAISELDHARLLIKIFSIYLSDKVLGAPSPSLSPHLIDFFSLSTSPSHVRYCLRSLTQPLPGQKNSVYDIMKNSTLWPSSISLYDGAKILSIINSNIHELNDIRGSGIFVRSSLMEHSCIPNCSFNSKGYVLYIRSLRNINQHEHLSIDYGEGSYKCVEDRRNILKKSHKFNCFCIGCTSLPDKSRGFTCPNIVENKVAGQVIPCDGVIYPVGIDDKIKEERLWKKSIENAQSMMQYVQQQQQQAASSSSSSSSSSPSSLPLASFSPSYPIPLYIPWSCCKCGYVLNQGQQDLAKKREIEAKKKMKNWREEEEEEEEDRQVVYDTDEEEEKQYTQNGSNSERKKSKFDFDKQQNKKKQSSNRDGDDSDSDGDNGMRDTSSFSDDDEDEHDEEDEDDEFSDELPSPLPMISKLSSLSPPALHPSHHLFFWACEYYARMCAQDNEEEFTLEAIDIYKKLIQYEEKYHKLYINNQSHPEYQQIINANINGSLEIKYTQLSLILADCLGQLYVVAAAAEEEKEDNSNNKNNHNEGNYREKAKEWFEKAREISLILNGNEENSNETKQLNEMCKNIPKNKQELEMKYIEFKQKIEELLYHTQIKLQKEINQESNNSSAPAAGKKKKKKNKKKSKQGGDGSVPYHPTAAHPRLGNIRKDENSDEDSDEIEDGRDEEEEDVIGKQVELNIPRNSDGEIEQELIMKQIEELYLNKIESQIKKEEEKKKDDMGDINMNSSSSSSSSSNGGGGGNKKKNKNKKK